MTSFELYKDEKSGKVFMFIVSGIGDTADYAFGGFERVASPKKMIRWVRKVFRSPEKYEGVVGSAVYDLLATYRSTYAYYDYTAEELHWHFMSIATLVAKGDLEELRWFR